MGKVRTQQSYAVCKNADCTLNYVFQKPGLKVKNRELCPTCRKKASNGK